MTSARGNRYRWLASSGLTAVLIAATAVAAAYATGRRKQTTDALRPAGIPASAPLSRISTMRLSALPARLAPGFTLTDQNGRVLKLRTMRGRVMILGFMDPYITGIRPVLPAEFTAAYLDLGKLAGRVTFAAINVNPYRTAVADVAAFSREHQLTLIPDWHFFTGPVPSLRAVWRDYHTAVQAPGPDAGIIHSPVIYFIGPRP